MMKDNTTPTQPTDVAQEEEESDEYDDIEGGEEGEVEDWGDDDGEEEEEEEEGGTGLTALLLGGQNGPLGADEEEGDEEYADDTHVSADPQTSEKSKKRSIEEVNDEEALENATSGNAAVRNQDAVKKVKV